MGIALIVHKSLEDYCDRDFENASHNQNQHNATQLQNIRHNNTPRIRRSTTPFAQDVIYPIFLVRDYEIFHEYKNINIKQEKEGNYL